MTSSIGNPISSIMGIGVGYLFYKNIDFAFIEKHVSYLIFSTSLEQTIIYQLHAHYDKEVHHVEEIQTL